MTEDITCRGYAKHIWILTPIASISMGGTVIHFSAYYLTGSLRPVALPTVNSHGRLVLSTQPWLVFIRTFSL